MTTCPFPIFPQAFPHLWRGLPSHTPNNPQASCSERPPSVWEIPLLLKEDANRADRCGQPGTEALTRRGDPATDTALVAPTRSTLQK